MTQLDIISGRTNSLPANSLPANSVPANSVPDRPKLIRVVGFVAAILALISAAVSFMVLMGFTSIEPNQATVQVALIVNGLLVSILSGAIIWGIVRHLAGAPAPTRGSASARPRCRLVRSGRCGARHSCCYRCWRHAGQGTGQMV